MKRILAMLLVFVLAVTMTACSSGSTPEDSSVPETEISMESSEVEEEKETSSETSNDEIESSNDETTSSDVSEEESVSENVSEESSEQNESSKEEETSETESSATKEPESTKAPESTKNPEPTKKPDPTKAPTPTQKPTTAPEHKHNYTATTTKATCTVDGYTTMKCSCGDSYKENKVAAIGHKYGEWVTTKEATRLTKGAAERKCGTCGHVETKELPKAPQSHEHSYTLKTSIAATCTAEGAKIYECSCGDSYTDAIPKMKHVYKDTVVKATCTAEGYTQHKCSCGDSYTDSKTKALGHDYKETTVAAKCATGGYTEHKCSRCKDTYQDNKTSALGHKFETVSDTATCTAAGKKTEACKVCGETKSSTSAAKGHKDTYEDVINATCTTAGSKRVICNTCGATVSEKSIPANGTHSYERMKLSDAAAKYFENVDSEYAQFTKCSDYSVEMCANCYDIKHDSVQYRYSDYDAASTMLGYVNNLRESVYGSAEYNLTLNSQLIEIAKIRAKEISVNYGHNTDGTYGENITSSGGSIYGSYVSWQNSSGHYNNMINENYTEFGYAQYWNMNLDENLSVYAVQTFR